MSVQKSNGPIIDPALCRCCRAIKKCRILTAEYNWMGKKEVYADMVMDCYGILLSHVDDNEKDSGVCATCVVRLREAIAFRHQVLQCEELFLQAKLDPPEEEKDINYANKLKKMELELKTEPKDYSSDHNSMDDRDNDPCPNYSEDDAEDNKPLMPLIPVEKKPEVPLPLKDEEVKSEDSEDYNDASSSDSDEPIKKKAKRKAKAKANGAKKKTAKSPKKQKAETDTVAASTEDIKIEFSEESLEDSREYLEVRENYEAPDEFNEPPMEFPEDEEFSENPGAENKKKRQWVRDRSNDVSEYQQLYEKLEANEDFHFRYLNMSKESFDELHQMVEELIAKEDTQMRKCVSTRERLTLCLRYYRTGRSYQALADAFRIGVTTASTIVKEVSRVLWAVLQPLYMPAPRADTWRQAEIGFRKAWSFPNCVGSIGGKHIIAKLHPSQNEYPKVSNLSYHKRLVTIALLAVTDPFNKIIALDIGNYAIDGEANILDNSKFYKRYMTKDFLPPKPLPGETNPVSHVLISDGLFYAKPNLVRPFPRPPNSSKESDQAKRQFNFFLERACTVNETFDMLMKSWGALDRPMECHVEAAVGIVKAICCLHNYVLAKHGKSTPSPDRGPKPSRSGRKALRCLKSFNPNGHRPTNSALAVRQQFVAYFNRLNPIVDSVQSCDAEVASAQNPNMSIDPTEADDQCEPISGPVQSVGEMIQAHDDTTSTQVPNESIDPTEANDQCEPISGPVQSVGDMIQTHDDTKSTQVPNESIDPIETDDRCKPISGPFQSVGDLFQTHDDDTTSAQVPNESIDRSN